MVDAEMAPKKVAAPEPEAVEAKPVEEVRIELLEGEFVYPDGSTYSGQYVNQGDVVQLHGEGVLQTGPETFQGTFENGLYKVGRYSNCSGAVYNGEFKNNLFHGVGEYVWPNGRSYSGSWREGSMHGKGKYVQFNFGADKVFEGFSIKGSFHSGPREQQEASAAFMREYGAECKSSAIAALKDLALRATAEGVSAEFLVPQPSEDESIEAVERRAAYEELVSGPFPSASTLQTALLQPFVARLEGTESTLQVNVVMQASDLSLGRLKRPQLQLVGQAVEFIAGDAAAGALQSLVLANLSRAVDVSGARWYLVDAQVQA